MRKLSVLGNPSGSIFTSKGNRRAPPLNEVFLYQNYSGIESPELFNHVFDMDFQRAQSRLS